MTDNGYGSTRLPDFGADRYEWLPRIVNGRARRSDAGGAGMKNRAAMRHAWAIGHQRTRGRRSARAARAAGVLLGLLTVAPAAAVPTGDDVLTAMGFSADQKQQVLSGQIVTLSLPEISDRELGVGMAFLIQTPPEALERYFENGTGYRFDSQVTAFAPISSAGALSDFNGIALAPGGAAEAARYLNAAPGEELNLSPQEIAAFQALQAQVQGGADAQQVVTDQIRKLLLARYQAYRAQGLNGIAPYARDGKLYQPAGDLREAVESAKVLRQFAPDFQTALLQYPNAQPPKIQEAFFWASYGLDGRPNFTLSHRMALQVGPHAYVLGARQYYASRVYNSVQEVAGMLPVQEGTLVIYINRTSTDQAAGFGSSMKHSIGQHMMANDLTQIFNNMRTRTAGQ
jgi:hypothetical protein